MELPTRPYDFDDEMMARTRADQQSRVSVYPFEGTAVVIGRGGKQDLELRTENIARDGVPLYKRPGGGCSVVLDAGNAVVALTLPLAGIGKINSAFAAISDWLIAGLAGCGIKGVEQRGVSDLVLAERKIGGSCVYRTRGLLYYATTLLIAPDLDLVERYLRHPPREPEYRKGRPHGQFMGSLSAHPVLTEAVAFRQELNGLLNSTLSDLSGI